MGTRAPFIEEWDREKRPKREEHILQFGEGNFIRAFMDWMIDLANEDGVYSGDVVVAQPIPKGLSEPINRQQGLYTVVIRDGEGNDCREEARVIRCVRRCLDPYTDYSALLEIARSEALEVIISNTTEQGITDCERDRPNDWPPSSYPGKLTALLYERFCHFHGASARGLLIIPLELIDDNGGELKRLVLRFAERWALGKDFSNWFLSSCKVVTTLVDRIVTGYPAGEESYFEQNLGYHDRLLTTCEEYNLLAIQGPKEWADLLPIHKTRANVIWDEDISPYRDRKLRILNGAHNAVGLAAFLAGHQYVIDFMEDALFRSFLEAVVYDEIVSNFTGAPREARAFAAQVIRRFSNPYLKHNLLQIAIHGCAKFRVRCLPSLLDFSVRTGQAPPLLAFSMAAFIAFYRGEQDSDGYAGKLSDGTAYPIRDSEEVLSFFEEVWRLGDPHAVAAAVLAHRSFWDGRDLSEVSGLLEHVAGSLERIVRDGVRPALRALMGER